MPAHDDWVYAKLYVGAVNHALDALAAEAVPEMIRASRALDASRWFFLRYVDEEGVHLRVRVRAPRGGATAIRRAIEPIAGLHLARVPSLPASPYRPAVPTPAVEPPPGQALRMGLVWARYEPEVDKYGATAIEHAEELFEASSQLAIDLLRAEAAGELSRKTLVPILMTTTREVLGAPESSAAFWRDYALFWLGGDGAQARQWRDRFAAKSRQLAADRTPVVVAVDELSPTGRAAIAAWDAALRRAKAAYDKLGSQAEGVRERIAFHTMHLTNNRLGVSMLEEAYFASLLEGALAAREAAA